MDWYSSVYNSFLIASVILFSISFSMNGHSSSDALLSGYSTLTVGILMIMLYIINVFGSNTSISSMLLNMGPFLLMLFILSALLYLVIKYRSYIYEGNISNDYKTYSFISSILLLLQTYVITDGINTDTFRKNNKLPKLTASICYLIGVLNFICLIIIYTILKYYTTDGYRNR